MKRFFTILVAILFTATMFSQTPGKMSYQAVIRDGSNNLLGSTMVGMRINILQGSESGTVVYTETQAPTTNVNGLVSIEIGGGAGFGTIDWGNGLYFIKTETDPTGGNNYTITGTNQILSVPYALYAKTAETLSPGTYPGQMLYWNGTAWVFVQVPANSEGATLTLINGTPTWAGGGSMTTVPDAPIIGIATAGNAQASVSFTAPASNGGSPITSYTATSNPGNITGTVAQAGSGTITVTGLTNGTAYTFTVTATNAIGTSAPSAPSNSVTPTAGASVPDAPIIGLATAGNAEASVSFTAPASNGGSPITSYTATSNPGNITGTVTQAGSGTITVTGLTNGTAYTFTVTANNAIGTSAPSAPSNSVTPTSDVINPATGKTWMDRNLGATQVAISSTDEAAYGDLYQWGRGADGHQIRTSNITGTLSSTDDPGHGDFILSPSSPYDWRNPQNDNLWQGVNGINNPCPAGYRLPTKAEFDEELATWSSPDGEGAYASPLKFSRAGTREHSLWGSILSAGNAGFYWSSTIDGTNSFLLYFSNVTAITDDNTRAHGGSVRCIKD